MYDDYKVVKPGDFGDEQEIPVQSSKDVEIKESKPLEEEKPIINKNYLNENKEYKNTDSITINSVSDEGKKNSQIVEESENRYRFDEGNSNVTDNSIKKLLADLRENKKIIEDEEKHLTMSKVKILSEIEALKSLDAQTDRKIKEKQFALQAINKCIQEME